VPSGRGLTRNSIRFPERWRGKKIITLITGALRDLEVYRPANETFQLIADSLDLELGGQFDAPEAYLLDYPLSKPKTLKRIEAAFVQAARRRHDRPVVRQNDGGGIPPAFSQRRTLPALTPIFIGRKAMTMGADGQVPALVQARVGSDVRILMPGDGALSESTRRRRLRAVLQFDFPDEKLNFRLTIDRGQCTLEETATEHPDLRVNCQSGVWAQIFMRQLEVREALKDRRLTLEGDKSLFTRLDRLFPRLQFD